jgi:FMN phosphatase YigB (HAD superfamily)
MIGYAVDRHPQALNAFTNARTMKGKRLANMLKAILLDLDNTLILFDEPAFYLRYMERIVPFFAPIMPPETFRDRLLQGIRGLARNDGTVSNEHYFMDLFCAGYEHHREAVWDCFMHFYQTEYDRIPVDVQTPFGLEAMLDQLNAWGLRLVVATNPLFPEIAQQKRMGWGGLDESRFELLTHLENMSFVKPRMEYYQQICAMIGLRAEECLMVGNDAVNDMVAGTAGLKTYLTTDAGRIDYRAVTREGKAEPRVDHPADFRGPLCEVVSVVARLRC